MGFTPIQSGLLIMPQAIAAMSLKMTMPRIIARLGYRAVLISNTLILGVLIALFATIGIGTPLWHIIALAFCYGFFSSLQFTSMNTLVYADVPARETSGASSIASTMQQMSMSFGVAVASLLTAVFIPADSRTTPREMIHGIHYGLLILAGMTVVATVVFSPLRSTDGESTSQHQPRVLEHAD
jgi:MFS family permease